MPLLRALALAVGCALATAAPAADDARIAMRFPNTNLPQILERLAPQLGERFIYDSSLSGRVTISVSRPVSKREAWELLHAALALRGFALARIPAGGYKVVPLSQATASDPWSMALPRDPETASEARVATLLDVVHAGAQELRDVIAPVLDPDTLAIALPTSNTLILATTERRLVALTRLVRALDADVRSGVRMRMLRERDVFYVFSALDARYGPDSGSALPVELWMDARTNSILYRTNDRLAAEIEAMLDELDVVPHGSGELEVIRLQHAEPSTIVEQLQALAADPGGVGPRLGSGLAGVSLNVVAEPVTSSIVVNASGEVVERVREVVAALDRRPRQVAIDALVQEWSFDDDFDFELAAGAEFSTGSGPSDIGSVQLLPGDDFPSPTAGDAIGIDVVRGASRLFVVANANDAVSRTVMQPHLVALNAEEQLIFSGNNVPVPVAAQETATAANAFQQRTTIERRDTGIELRVRPTIGSDGHVELDLQIKIEDVAPALVSADLGPTFLRRDIHTVAQLRPGAAVAVAAPIQVTTSSIRIGVPFLRDIPLVGHLFARTEERTRRTRIVIAVQATPLPTDEALVAYGIRRRLALERAVARERVLDGAPDTRGAFALRLTAGEDREQAFALAARLDSELHPARVVEWTQLDGLAAFDVQLFGFARYAEAADEAFRLYADGERADVVPMGDLRSALE